MVKVAERQWIKFRLFRDRGIKIEAYYQGRILAVARCIRDIARRKNQC